jgi:copper chaperone NosL
LALVGVLFMPFWRIELDAPQYPEGLLLQIYTGKLGGDVDIINGLESLYRNEDIACSRFF